MWQRDAIWASASRPKAWALTASLRRSVVRETETLAPKPGSEHNTPERALGLGPDLRCHVARLRVCRLRLGFRVYNESILGRQNGNPGEKPSNGRIAVKVINHLGDEVMKVFRVNR